MRKLTAIFFVCFNKNSRDRGRDMDIAKKLTDMIGVLHLKPGNKIYSKMGYYKLY